ncbi:ImmA/IrrE family metallo-endopeptidase [Vagococcus vulneris]|nr:ImmA/IrrE family metallo-endopeptidase [Vagococcus vulneris]
MKRSGIYLAKVKTIFINCKLLESGNAAFEISHELAHCLKEHDNYYDYYTATDSSRNKLEREANQVAIEILIEIYLHEFDIDKEQFNVVRFMEYFKISNRLEYYVEQSLLNYI